MPNNWRIDPKPIVDDLTSLLKNQFCGDMTDAEYEKFCFQMIEFTESLKCQYPEGNQMLFLIKHLVGVLFKDRSMDD